MAYLPGFADFNSYLKGQTSEDSLFPTTPILKSGTGTTGTQAFGAAAPAPSPTPQAQPAAPSTPTAPTTPGPSSVASGSGINRYFAPIQQGIGKSQGKLDEVYNAFSGQAGPARQEFGEPERQTLTQAYQAPSDEGTQKAKALVNAKYTGPQGLDQGAVSGIKQGSDELKDQARALRTTGGLQTTIQDTTPGLTAGSSRFEARSLLKDPSVKTRSREAEEDVNRFYGGLVGGQEKAKEFAAARTAQEADVAAKSRGLLEGASAGITGEIDTRVAGEQAQRDAAAKAYDDLLAAAEAGDYEGLQGAIKSADQYSDEDLTKFDSPEAQLTREAKAKYDEIMGSEKYASIKDRPLLSRNITSRGKEYYSIIQPDGQAIDIRDVRGLPEKDHALLVNRQRELEPLFRAGAGKTGGKYQDVMKLNLHGEKAPLDEGGDPVKGGVVTPPDPKLNTYISNNIAPYLDFDPGLSPSRQNVSSEVERKQYNKINEILDLIERIDGSEEPMRAASIAASIEAYLWDEASNMQARQDAGDKGATSWAQQIKKARKRYTKAKEAGTWALVTSAIVSIIFPPLGVWYGISQAGAAIAGEDAYGGGKTDPIGRLGGKLVTGTTTDDLEKKGTPGAPGIAKK